jgi:hypothetical protein
VRPVHLGFLDEGALQELARQAGRGVLLGFSRDDLMVRLMGCVAYGELTESHLRTILLKEALSPEGVKPELLERVGHLLLSKRQLTAMLKRLGFDSQPEDDKASLAKRLIGAKAGASDSAAVGAATAAAPVPAGWAMAEDESQAQAWVATTVPQARVAKLALKLAPLGTAEAVAAPSAPAPTSLAWPASPTPAAAPASEGAAVAATDRAATAAAAALAANQAKAILATVSTAIVTRQHLGHLEMETLYALRGGCFRDEPGTKADIISLLLNERIAYSELDKSDLCAILREAGLPQDGTMPELLERVGHLLLSNEQLRAVLGSLGIMLRANKPELVRRIVSARAAAASAAATAAAGASVAVAAGSGGGGGGGAGGGSGS